MANNEQMRIVLVGKTGSGKSATGNSLLHSKTAFQSLQSASSVTKGCKKANKVHSNIHGRQVELTVIDTPGFFDTKISNETTESIIGSEIFDLAAPGVHAFLILIKVTRFSPEEMKTINLIQNIFGYDACNYCVVVFTAEDQLDEGQSIKEYINTSSDLKELVRLCGGRYFAINNKLGGENLEKSTKKLLEMINDMVTKNFGRFYTNMKFQEIQKKREEEKRNREEAARKKKEAEDKALIDKALEKERREAEAKEKKTREEEHRKAKEREDQVREEERRKAKEREDQIREEERRKAREREEEARDAERRRAHDQMRQYQSLPRSSSGGMYIGDLDRGLGSLQLGGYDNGYSSSRQSIPSYTQSYSSPFGGRFTGEYVSSNGSANGQPIFEGSSGGIYHISSGGNRVYHKRE